MADLIMSSRRGFLSGLASALAMPAIVPLASLMPVRQILMPETEIIQVLCRVIGPNDRVLDEGMSTIRAILNGEEAVWEWIQPPPSVAAGCG